MLWPLVLYEASDKDRFVLRIEIKGNISTSVSHEFWGSASKTLLWIVLNLIVIM
jgi:hypothetical protein